MKYFSPWKLITALLLAAIVMPIAVIGLSWLQFDSETWIHVLETRLASASIETLFLLVGAAIGSGVLGTSLAALVTFLDFPGRKFLSWSLLLTLATPAYVVAFIWIDILDFSGPVATYLRNQGIGPLPEIRSTFGGVLILSLSLYPYVYLLSTEAFLSQGKKAWDAARSLGRSPIRTFFSIQLPLARPWIGAGVLLVCMETLADFGAVSLLGIETFSVSLYRVWHGLQAPLVAAQMASILVLTAVVLFVTESRLQEKRQRFYRFQGDGGVTPRWRPKFRYRLLVSIFAWSIFLVSVAIPISRLLWQAWMASGKDIAFEKIGEAAFNSVFIGIVAAAVTTLAGLFLVVSTRLEPGWLTLWTSRISSLGYSLPGAVLAVGVFLPLVWLDRWLQQILAAVGISVGLLITGSIGAMLFGYAIRFLAHSRMSLASAIERVSPRLEEAASSLGSKKRAIAWRVHLPLLRKAMMLSVLMIVIDVMKEMPLTLMTRPYGWDTLSVRIYQLTKEGLWDLAAIPALVLVAAGLVPTIFLILRLSRERTNT